MQVLDRLEGAGKVEDSDHASLLRLFVFGRRANGVDNGFNLRKRDSNPIVRRRTHQQQPWDTYTSSLIDAPITYQTVNIFGLGQRGIHVKVRDHHSPTAIPSWNCL